MTRRVDFSTLALDVIVYQGESATARFGHYRGIRRYGTLVWTAPEKLLQRIHFTFIRIAVKRSARLCFNSLRGISASFFFFSSIPLPCVIFPATHTYLTFGNVNRRKLSAPERYIPDAACVRFPSRLFAHWFFFFFSPFYKHRDVFIHSRRILFKAIGCLYVLRLHAWPFRLTLIVFTASELLFCAPGVVSFMHVYVR